MGALLRKRWTIDATVEPTAEEDMRYLNTQLRERESTGERGGGRERERERERVGRSGR